MSEIFIIAAILLIVILVFLTLALGGLLDLSIRRWLRLRADGRSRRRPPDEGDDPL